MSNDLNNEPLSLPDVELAPLTGELNFEDGDFIDDQWEEDYDY